MTETRARVRRYPRYYHLVPDPHGATNPHRRLWKHRQEYRVDGPTDLKVRGGPFPYPDWSRSGLTEDDLLRTRLADVLPPREFNLRDDDDSDSDGATNGDRDDDR